LRPRRSVGRLPLPVLVATLGALAMARPLAAQQSQWSDVIYVPGHWQAGRLVPAVTHDPATDSMALVMRVDYFSHPPRWRAEVRRSSDGQMFGDPTVILGTGTSAVVVTAVGTTPLAQHALGRDSLVRAATLIFDAAGRRTGAVSGRFADRAADGSILRIVFRRSVRGASFDDKLLDPRNASAGAQFLASRLTAVGDQRSASVVATAGARGVDQVQTPGGTIAINPDTMAVVRMEHYAVGDLRLEDFMRLGGLGPYKPAPPDSGTARP